MSTPTALRLDLEGLREQYEQARRPLSPRGRRVVVVLGALAAVVVGVGAMRAVLDGGLGHLLASLLPALLLQAGTGLLGLPALQPQTRLSPALLDVRRDVVHRDRVPWDEVVGVRPPGRWEDAGRADLVDGRSLPLPHVPREDVVRLGAALGAARERRRRPG